MKKYSEVIIVGSGLAGISCAIKLADLGINSILLEAGKNKKENIIQDSYSGYAEKMHLTSGLKNSRDRMFGGTSNSWGGGCAELDKEDFIFRDWIKNSGWPISKDLIDTYYEEASIFMGINFKRIRNPKMTGMPNIEGFELKNLEYSKLKNFNYRFYEKLVNHPKISLIENYTITKFIRTKNNANIEKLIANNVFGEQIELSGKYYVIACGGIENARLLLNTQENESPALGNLDDNLGKYFCEHPIAPIATIFPKSKFQNYEVQSHINKPNLGGEISTPYYRLPFDIQKKEKLLNCVAQFTLHEDVFTEAEKSAFNIKKYLEDSREFSLKIKDIKNSLINLPRLISYIKSRNKFKNFNFFNLYDPNKLRLALRYQIEQPPIKENRIELDDSVDVYGLKRARLIWKTTDIEKRTTDYLFEYTNNCFYKNGLGYLKKDKIIECKDSTLQFDLRGGVHHCGTTRMSSLPSDGVVDQNLKVHECDNLFISGSSIFPTNGWVNPTLSIIAFSIRLAHHLQTKIESNI